MKQDIVLLISLLLSAFLISSCGGKKSGANEAEIAIPVEVTTIKLGEVVQSLNYNRHKGRI